MTVIEDVRLVSNSEVQTFKDCPRRWWLAWFRGLKPRSRGVTGAGSTGTRIHAALAALYTPGGKTGDATLALRRIQAVDRLELDRQINAAQFQENGDELISGLNGDYDKLLKAFDLEHAMLDGYLEWIEETGVDQHLEVISVEQKIEAPFPVDLAAASGWRYPVVKLIAKLDARVHNMITGAVKFIDHKTVGGLRDPLLGLNQQMLHYHALEELLTEPGQPRAEGALYNMLRKVKRTRASKPPYYSRIAIDHNRFELEGYGRQLFGAIDRLDKTEAAIEAHPELHQMIVPPRPSRDCTWKCQFFKICRMFDDGSRVEAALEEHYEVGDPLSYYDTDTEETSEGTV